MNTPARIVFLLQDLAVGGTQRQAVALASRLDRERFAPELWTCMAGDGMLKRAVGPDRPDRAEGPERAEGPDRADGVDLPMRQLSPLPFVGPDAIVRLGFELARQDIDILLLFTAVPNIWGRLLGQGMGTARQQAGRLCKRSWQKPVILATCRGGGAPARQHEKWLWRLADMHLSNTHAMASVLSKDYGVPAARIRVIHNGVDVESFHPVPRSATQSGPAGPVFLHLARLVEDKDHATSLRAFASVLDAYPGAVLRIVGDGPKMGELKRLAGELFSGNRSQQVRFEGERLDVEAVLAGADVLVLSSIREAMPNVILEAMAMGLPVISTQVGGVGEMVISWETGLLTPVGDARAMAEAMKGLASSPSRRVAMGQAGRARAEAHFSFDAMTRSHEAVFAQCLAEREVMRTQPPQIDQPSGTGEA